MRAADLDLRELLHYDPQGGVIRFGSQRALLLDAVAIGLLRQELIQALGTSAARAILTRFGYAHGWRTANTLRGEFAWDDEREWRTAGGRLHTLQGLVIVRPPAPAEAAATPSVGDSIWHESYEAEQHLLLLGQAEAPVCWTLTGFASGYLSCAHGREVLCVEERCRGKGDAVCRLVARFREDWGDEVASELSSYYEKACLDEALGRATEELKRLEARIRSREKELGPTTVAATDPSGLVARLIHAESPRTGGPFVAINCGAVPEGLLESELFGHVKGSFTGASQDRPGLFEAAQGGTLFLDEVGEVPPPMQVKLLRALQEREVRRVGENRSRAVDVRVLAATNRDLVSEVNAARFRQDLYYRLRVVEIRVPPLRERREDILPLARTFLQAAAERTRRKVTGLTPAAANRLVRHAWPGNVRELENAIERAVVLSDGSRIDVEDLPEELALALPAPYAPGDVRPLDEVERDYILAVLRANAGNRARAAEQLGIGTATLYRKLKRYEGVRSV